MSDEQREVEGAPAAPTETAEPATPESDVTQPVSDVEAEQPLPEPRPAPPPEPPESDATPTETPPPRGRRDVLLDVLVVSTVVLVIATVLLGLMAFAPRIAPIKSTATRLAVEALEEDEITDVAKRFARNFLTVDYRTIDADIKRLTADATGDFKDQIGQVLKLSREQFVDRKATSRGKVNEAVLLFREGSDARVQVLAERTIRNVKTKRADEEPEAKVLDITMVKTSDGWKVDNVREVQVQGER